MQPFHLAFPVSDLAATRRFYVDTLGLGVGRESDHWIDFDFHGHQITAHLAPDECQAAATNLVDGEAVPVRHFGLVMVWDAWESLGQRLRDLDIPFLIEPTVRFEGLPGEQGTMFVRDPSGNALEFKSFRDPGRLFAT
ncbi:MAG: VOC family protein [Pseudomonadota bacterium]